MVRAGLWSMLGLLVGTSSVFGAGFDPAFGVNGVATVVFTNFGGSHPIARTADDKILGIVGGDTDRLLYRALPDGTLDTTFDDDGFIDLPAADGYAAPLPLPDGRFVLSSQTASGVVQVLRYLPDGTPDPSFDGDGVLLFDPSPNRIDFVPQATAVAGDAILLAGDVVQQAALVRILADGSLDPSFGTGGILVTPYGITSAYGRVVEDADGKLLLPMQLTYGASQRQFNLVRLHPDGTPDTTFADGDGVAVAPIIGGTGIGEIALRPDGRVLMTGFASPVPGGNRDFLLVRFEPDGAIDTTFGTGGIVFTDFFGGHESSSRLVLAASGHVHVIGDADPPGPSGRRVAVARYLEDGTLDTTFDDDGIAVADVPDGLNNFSQPTGVARFPNGSFLVAGSNFPVEGVRNFLLRVRATTCAPCEVPLPDESCVAPPPSGCIRSTTLAGSKVAIRNVDNDLVDRFTWRWKFGGATTADDFGSPDTTDALRVCTYTGTPAAPDVLASAPVPAGDVCGSRACWRRLGGPEGTKGWRRKSVANAAGGIRSLVLKTGESGRASIKLTARGMNVDPPALPPAGPVWVRLQSATGQCWEAEHPLVVKSTTTDLTASGN